jgi:hypothetical protein
MTASGLNLGEREFQIDTRHLLRLLSTESLQYNGGFSDRRKENIAR